VKPKLRVVEDPEALAKSALEVLMAACLKAVDERGRCTVALSGGSTPRRLYARLALELSLPFSKIHFFFGDERHVPPDHPDSNYRMAKEALFSRAPIPDANIHRIRAEEPNVEEAAAQYEAELRSFFAPRDGRPARLDVVLLGLGGDGHTASLFPGTPAVDEKVRWVMGQRVEKLNTERITLTPPLLNAAHTVIFQAQGEDKASAVRAVLEGKETPEEIPAKVVVVPEGDTWWFLDRAAAAKLRSSTVSSGS
jgi:6-phosphogluconolactonase